MTLVFMPRFIYALIATPAFIQLILAVIKLVESPGNGPAKKAAVLDIVSAVYDELAANFKIRFTKTFVMRLAELVIEIAVRFYNLIGEFKHSQKDKTENKPVDPTENAPQAPDNQDAKPSLTPGDTNAQADQQQEAQGEDNTKKN